MGEGTLPIQCAQLLTRRGHKVLGVISSDPLVAEWAAEHCLPFCSAASDFLPFLTDRPFDYLFSIVNPLILSEDILNLPKALAINYHDSPLPKYAGLYASSWALLHGETQHAITWHVMKPGLDVGDILKQVPVDIAPQETALTLNAKCYEAAIAAFADLIDELATTSISAVPQDLSDRSYFSRTQKPAIGLQFRWQRPAQELDRLVRALDFGPFPNPLGLPVVVVGNNEKQDLVLVSQLKVLDSLSQSLPGTIVEIAPTALQITTSTHDVVLQKLSNLQGKPIEILDLVAQFGLQAGDRLPELPLELAQKIDQFDARLARHESYWVSRLSQLHPLSLPKLLRSHSAQDSDQDFDQFHWLLPESVRQSIAHQYSDFTIADVVSAAFVVYLARICNQTSFDLGFHHADLQAELVGLELFFSNQVPWHVDLDLKQPFRVALEHSIEQRQHLRKHRTYTRNIIARYPALAAKAELQLDSLFPISIHQVNSPGDGHHGIEHNKQLPLSKLQHHQFAQHLTLTVLSNGSACDWGYRTLVLSRVQIEGVAAQFLTFLQDLLVQPDTQLANLPLTSFHLQGMTDAERHRVVVEWNATEVEYPQHLCLHDLFSAQSIAPPRRSQWCLMDNLSLTRN